MSGEKSQSFLKRVVLDEIAGKNAAIHAYDKIIWTIRSGYLTLVFAGWGLFLSASADGLNTASASEIATKAWPLIQALFAVSVGLSVGGLVIDLNYVRRKFRVIYALNGLMAVILDRDETELEDRSVVADFFRPFLSVSGDSGSRNFRSVNGYKGARTASLSIYLFPVIGVAIAVGVLRWAS
jgi:hypothetical protein